MVLEVYEVKIIKHLDKVWCCILKITKTKEKKTKGGLPSFSSVA